MASGEETAMTRIRRILHPTDFSSASRPAFERAIALARDARAELIVAHVLSPILPVVGEGYIPPQTYESIDAAGRTSAQRKLEVLVARARKARVRARALLLEGSPHDRIAKAAKARRADLIVMGTHGRSGLARLFIGSVASRVVSAAPCPVMTVRGR
jgi:nucleotide-binding universal stress UspA family protein